MRGIFISDSYPVAEGHGGGVVSFHEMNALGVLTKPVEMYTRPLGHRLLIDAVYPGNPYMFDFCIATAIRNPESVDIAKIYGAGLPITMKLLRTAGAKVIPTTPVHNLKLSLEEHIKLHEDASCYGVGRRFGPPDPHIANDYLFRLTMLGVCKYATTVICPGSPSVSFLREYFGEKAPKNIKIIPHGTDIPEKIATDETRSKSEFFTVMHLGACGGDKGDRYLQQAWAQVFPKLRDSRLVFMGANANWFSEGFEATGLGKAGDYMIFTFDRPPADTKETAFLSASVYVQSSVTEGWGIPVGEAMAHGVPVIITDKTGAVDMVTDGEDGFVIPIRSPEAIAEKIQYFHDNPGEVSRMGANARKKAEEYSWDKIKMRYVELMREEME